MKKSLGLVAVTLVLVTLVGCAAGPNQLSDTPNEKGQVAGFWHGLLHGFIVVFTFIISLFTDSVRIYEVHNSGNWYNFGFLLGAMVFFGCSGGGACKCSRDR